MKTKRRAWTIKDVKFIEENLEQYKDKEFAAMYNVTEGAFKQTRHRYNIVRTEWDTPIKKGNVPPNKGKKIEEYMTPEGIESSKKHWWYKGQEPRFKRAVGEVYWQESKKRMCIVTETCRTYPYARYLWEQHSGVKLTRSHNVGFHDGNPRNCTLENIRVETCAEKVKRIATTESRSRNMRKYWEGRKAQQPVEMKRETPYQFYAPFKQAS